MLAARGLWLVLGTAACSTKIDRKASAMCQQAVEGAREASDAEHRPAPDPRTVCETCCVAQGLHNVMGEFCDCGSRGFLRQLLYSF